MGAPNPLTTIMHDRVAFERRHTAVQEATAAQRKERISAPIFAAIGDLHGVIADTRDALHLAKSDDDVTGVFDAMKVRLTGIVEDTLPERRADLTAAIAAQSEVPNG